MKKNIFLVKSVCIISDIVALSISFVLAFWIRFHSSLIPVTKGIPPFHIYMKAMIFLIIVWIVIFHNLKMYRPRLRLSKVDEAYSALLGIIIGFLISMVFTFWYREFTFSRILVLIAVLLGFITVVSFRLILRVLAINALKRGIGRINCAIIGYNDTAFDIARKMETRVPLGYKFIGFILNEDEVKNFSKDLKYFEDVSVNDFIKRHRIKSIIWARKQSNHKEMMSIVNVCEQNNCKLSFITDFFNIITTKISTEDFDGIPLLKLKEIPLLKWENGLIKRLFDIVFSQTVMLFFLFPFLVIALLIKITSRGPVFFKQKRITENNRTFKIYKFRTMVENAETKTGPVWASKNDSRTTYLGRIMRRFSIDELPQFINVLKGDMSIVGPRPERPFFVEKFKQQIPKYYQRHTVKCGITGWAQVNGLRGNVPVEERTIYDLYYIENWSLIFDLKIILRTIFEFLFHTSAY